MNPQVSIPEASLASFCRKQGISRLSIFGSALRSDFGPESDIDVLVEFLPGRTPGLLGMAGMELDFVPHTWAEGRSPHSWGSEPLFSCTGA